MKKWIFFGLTALLLAGGLLGLVFFHDVQQPPAPTTEATTSQPTAETGISVPTVATEPTAPAFDASLLSARHAFVYEPAADTLHFTRGDQQEAISPASLTKLMTAFVAMRHLDPKATVAVGYEAKMIAKDSSIAAVSPGTVLEVEMILQGMLMQSGNDAAYVLAVAAGRAIAGDPSLDAQAALDIFMEEVNRQLKGNGILNTHFVTPDGYDAEGHQTTAEDPLKITKLAMTNPLILRYCAMEEAVVTYLSGQNYTWKNTNFLLRQEFEEFYNPYATGLKTGSTSKAGACVIATFEDGDRLLVIGILGCETVEQRFQDAETLFEFYR